MTYSPYLLFEDRARANPEAPLLVAPVSAGLPYAPQGFRHSYGEGRGNEGDGARA